MARRKQAKNSSSGRSRKTARTPERRQARRKQAVRAAAARGGPGSSRAKRTAKTPARTRDGVAPGMPPVSARLTVRNITAAVDFYERAFGFRRRFVLPGPDGQPVHAEMTHGTSVIMMGAETPDQKAPALPGATPLGLYVYVPDVDATTAQARDAGATVTMEPRDEFWGDRVAGLLDPEGHRWMLATFKKLVPFDQIPPPASVSR